jgi:hypothetical protein
MQIVIDQPLLGFVDRLEPRLTRYLFTQKQRHG